MIMKLSLKRKDEKKAKSALSAVLFVFASIAALAAAALLASNIYLFNYTVAQYVEMGYTKSEVLTSLLIVQQDTAADDDNIINQDEKMTTESENAVAVNEIETKTPQTDAQV